MNSIWLKIAGIAVVAVVVVVILGRFGGEDSPPAPSEETKTFDDMVERDRQFLEEPEPVEEPPQDTQPAETDQEAQDVAQGDQTPSSASPTPSPAPQETPDVIHVKPLSEMAKIEAERLFNVAVPGRSIGRLPMTGFKLMVDNCREIIRKWPDSFYAYQCKRLLADMPERYQMRYKVTEQEKDISRFLEPRPGTQPVKITEQRR
jgi:hypothetical protein